MGAVSLIRVLHEDVFFVRFPNRGESPLEKEALTCTSTFKGVTNGSPYTT